MMTMISKRKMENGVKLEILVNMYTVVVVI